MTYDCPRCGGKGLKRARGCPVCGRKPPEQHGQP
jgi:hypothetical protein